MKYLRFCLLVLFAVLLPVIGYYYVTSNSLEWHERDLERARDAVAEKAEGGDAKAQFDLGEMYAPEDYVEAVKWWRKAADQGHADAQVHVGWMYASGKGGVLKDEKEAVKWYRKAADQGYAKAQDNLANAYVFGLGVLKDEKEAVKWYRKAADQGYASAQKALAWSYAEGRGVLKDDVAAYARYSLSISLFGDQGMDSLVGVYKKSRDELAEKMTPEQIAEAQELSKELLKQIEENKKNKAK